MIVVTCECGARTLQCPARRYTTTPRKGTPKPKSIPILDHGEREVPGEPMDLSKRPDDGRFLNIG